jgi:hypothetical protein
MLTKKFEPSALENAVAKVISKTSDKKVSADFLSLVLECQAIKAEYSKPLTQGDAITLFPTAEAPIPFDKAKIFRLIDSSKELSAKEKKIVFLILEAFGKGLNETYHHHALLDHAKPTFFWGAIREMLIANKDFVEKLHEVLNDKS